MNNSQSVINSLMVELFNNILLIEENILKASEFNDITVSEAHTIDAIGIHSKKKMSELAKKLRVTLGTLTVSVDKLVKKGYALRYPGENDKRVVMVGLTDKGSHIYSIHRNFHTDMVEESLSRLTENETEVLAKALLNIRDFFNEKDIHLKMKI